MRSLLQGAAAVIVFGGTLGAVLVSFPLRDLAHGGDQPAPPRRRRRAAADGTVALIGRFALRARKEGLLALEDDAERMSDPFLKRALALAIDGTDVDDAAGDARGRDHDAARSSRRCPARVFEAAGGYAPTVGILGAVLGLIHVMENLADPSNLGSGIAVAFVATVYGVGSANLIFLPDRQPLPRPRPAQRAPARSGARRRHGDPGRAQPAPDRSEAARAARPRRAAVAHAASRGRAA